LQTLSQLVVRGRYLLLLLWLGAVGWTLWELPKLEFSFSLHPLLEGSGEEVDAVKEFYRAFPPAEGHAVVTVTWDSAVTVDRLRQAAAWGRELKALPEVHDVLSPGSLLDLKLQDFTLDEWARLGGSGAEPLEMGDAPGMSTIRGRFISRDLKSLAFHVQKKRGFRQAQFFEALEGTVAKWNPPARVLGTSVMLRDMGNSLRNNLGKFLTLELVALLVILPAFVRSFRSAYFPLLTAMTGVMVFLAIFAVTGHAIGLIYLASPVLILVIGLSDSIHLQQQFDEARARGLGVAESLALMFKSVGSACALNSVTSALGFLSLVWVKHEEVAHFGMWSALGVVIAFISSVVFLPVALAIVPGKGAPIPLQKGFDPAKLRRFTIPAAIMLLVLSLGMTVIRVDSNIAQELPADTKSVRDLEWYDANFQGSDRLEIEVSGPLDNPEVFAAVAKMQRELGAMDGVMGSNSYVDVVRFLLAPEIVETGDGPYLGLRALGELKPFPQNLLDRSGQRAAIIFYTSNRLGSHQFREFEARFHQIAEEAKAAEFKLTGYTAMAYRSVNTITDSFLSSIGTSVFTITLVLAIALRSPRLALISMIPNALPILASIGLTGWLDIPLRLGVLVIFSIGLGLAVDDTVHVMVRLRQLRAAHPERSIRELMDETLRTTGFAITLTSVTLVIAASAFMVSDFATVRDTGLMLAFISVIALSADLLILPWLVEKFSQPSSP